MNIIHLFDNEKKTYYRLNIIKKDGNWCWETFSKSGNCSSHITKFINPIPGLVYRLKWNCKLLYLKVSRQTHKQCQGCGEGYVRYRIADSNESCDSDKKLLCCPDCVNFYDQHLSKEKLNLTWQVL